MKAVIYLDSYFFMNMLLNLMLLYLLRRFRRLCGNPFRMIPAAAFGGLIACFLVLHPSYGIVLQGLIAYPLAGGGMIILAFGYHGFKKFLKNLCWLVVITVGLGGLVLFLTEHYISSCYMAGSETSLQEQEQDMHIGIGIIIIAALLGTGIIAALHRSFARQIKKDVGTYHATLFLENRRVTVAGYLDSGNMLKEPVSGKPVAILEEGSFLELFEGQAREDMKRCLAGGRASWDMAGSYLGRMRLIPYQSIGKKSGLMNGFVADRMEVAGLEAISEIRPVIAVYSGTLSSDGSYQMILPGI